MASIALQFGYYGANTWLPSYLVSDLGVNTQSMGWYVAGTYTMTIVGKIITRLPRPTSVGRRAIWVVAGGLTAVYLPVLIYAATPANVAYLLLVFGFLYGGAVRRELPPISRKASRPVSGGRRSPRRTISGRIGATTVAASDRLRGRALFDRPRHRAARRVAYAVCALVPGLFIREKMFDPTAVPAAPETQPARA